jgi:MerR family transcriptional regulator, light-induced transcriptional regulator
MDTTKAALSSESLISIGRLAELTGISPDRLRAWERRYGRPRPTRIESGHRRYRHSEVVILREVAELLAQGNAVGETLTLDDEGLKERYLCAVQEQRGFENLDMWLTAVHDYDGHQLRSSLEVEFGRLKLIEFLDQRIGPFLTRIGSEWAQGSIELRHEHFASNVIERFLDELLARTPLGTGRSIILTSFPNEQHSIGLKMLELTARTIGMRPIWIGSGTPLIEILQSTLETRSMWIGISLSLADGGPRAMRRIKELSAQLPDTVQIVVGGSGVPPGARGNQSIHPFHSLTAYAEWMQSRGHTPS